MAGEDELAPHVINLGEGASGSKPNEHNVETQSLPVIPHNQAVGSELVCDLGNPMMQFVVQNFDQINALYLAFSSREIGASLKQPIEDSNKDRPVTENPYTQRNKRCVEGIRESDRLLKKRNGVVAIRGQKENSENQPFRHRDEQKSANNFNFYNDPFVLNESERNVRELVTSPFTKRIKDYEMPDGLKVPSNLKSYDGLSDPDDHLTMFMGTMDIHKLPEPAWCRIFSITLCGAARFWYDNLPPASIDSFHQLRDKFRANFLQQRRFQKTQAEILGIRQREEESLKDYLARFGKETLHMVDRSDAMMTGAFISGLRPGRAFKELIAQPPVSLEDLYIYINGFIRAEEANNANRCRDSKG